MGTIVKSGSWIVKAILVFIVFLFVIVFIIRNQKPTVHIGMSIDKYVVEGLATTIQSIIDHGNNMNYRIVIHILVPCSEEDRIRNRIKCLNLPTNIKIEYTIFDLPDEVEDLIRVHKQHLGHLTSPSNFARFYLAQKYRSLLYLIYLDVDLIVLHDVSELWEELVNTDKLLVVMAREFDYGCHFKYNKVAQIFFERNNVKFEKDKCPCNNAGVLGFNLKKWRDKQKLDDAKFWMEKNKENNLWSLGNQPILQIISHDDWKNVDKKWNIRYNHKKELQDAYIIHWCGPDKPWQEDMKGQSEVNIMWEELNKKSKCNI